MSLTINTTTQPEDAASFIASAILDKLKLGKRVIFFVTGGSSIFVCVKISEILRKAENEKLIVNLTVMLTDERYGPVGHTDSNWQQLTEKGFSLPQAKLIPVLIDADRNTTVKIFNESINEEFMIGGYKIGIFGIGADGHTAGMLPNSEAVQSNDFVFGYDAPTFSRVTMTPRAIEKLDEAVVWVQGEDKWKVVKNLLEENIEIEKQPVQILKKITKLTIFTNYKKE